MDGGPFRVQRPTERRAQSRPELAYRPPEEPAPASEAPRAEHRASSSRYTAPEKKSPKRFLLPIVSIIIIAALCVVGWFFLSKNTTAGTAIDGSRYQAVFFTNGQVYFGKLHQFNDEYMRLTDIYYLQTQTNGEGDSENPQQTSTDQSNVQLIKLGDEIHGPEDEMIISKDQLLFYENLKADGKVTQSIQKHKDAN